MITTVFLISRGLSFRDTHFSWLSLDYLQIVRPLAKTGDDHIEESTEYNEVSTEYNEVITEQEVPNIMAFALNIRKRAPNIIVLAPVIMKKTQK